MPEKFTILLLSAPIGSGHRLAAQALEQVLREREDVEVIHGDVFAFFPHFLGTLFLHTYLWILSRCPWLYAFVYKWGNREGGSLWLRAILNRALALLGRNYLRKIAPAAVLATHATPAGIISCYKEQHPDLWLGAVVTDFCVHRWWLCEGVDAYFVADERLRDKIHLPAEIIASGIPVRRDFQNLSASECRAAFGWGRDEKICLLMGGGEGLLPMRELVSALREEHLPGLKLVALTGHNAELAQSLKINFPSLEVYGFREDVPRMLAGADVLLTKAGGLTAAEALASGVELVIYKPLPGQEQGNAAFLHAHYGARVAHDVAAVVRAVREFCETDAGARRKAARGNILAAGEICDYVLKKLRERE